jgi:predicted metal-dependent peptidase
MANENTSKQFPGLAEVTPEQLAAFDLNIHTYRLMQEEPFFAAVMRHVNKVSSEAVPTAGVTVDPKTAQFVMYYNPRFFCGLTDVQKRGVLTHELYHLVLEHCTTRAPQEKRLAQAWNYATDLAINSFLDGKLPEFCLFPGKGPFKDYPPMMTAEWYFNKLLNDPEMQKQQGGEGEGEQGEGEGGAVGGQFDDHEGWGERQANGESQAATEVAKERLRDIMKKATEEVLQKGSNWGTVPADVQKDILRRIQNTVDWKKVLRCFVRTSKRSDKVGTVRKINKRYPYIHPGKKVTRHANIAVSIDQSGSVSDSLLATFYAELNALSDIATFTVIPFDSRVVEDKIFTWKKGSHRRWERVACGGTDFDAPTAYVNERNFDGHIILTDMCAPKPRPSKCQRLWCTDEANAKQPYFQCTERVIAVRVKGEEG